MVGDATYKRGITDSLTLEGHGEFLVHDAHAAGVDAAIRTGSIGILTLTGAAGGDGNGSGFLRGIGFEHHGTLFSLSGTVLTATDGFRQIGDSVLSGERFKERVLAQTGVVVPHLGALSLAYVMQSYQSQPQQQTISLSDSVVLGRIGAINLTVSRITGYNPSTTAYLTFTHALQARSAVNATAVVGSGPGAQRDALQATLLQNPPIGPGSGYRLSAATDGDYDADWKQQFNAAQVEAEVARTGGVAGQSLYAVGAATWLDGAVNAARSVTGSFAVVDVGGVPDVPVYVDNQLITHTDAQGRAVLPNMRSFEQNRIEIDPVELPLDTSIQARMMVVAPAYRSGVIVRFPVERVRGGTFRLIMPDGHAVPAGALVGFKGKLFPVALDGMTYVTGFDHGMAGSARWAGGHCKFRLDPPPQHNPLPDMGTVLCQ
jgi:outer membrane usher protein